VSQEYKSTNDEECCINCQSYIEERVDRVVKTISVLGGVSDNGWGGEKRKTVTKKTNEN
jgi:hypothetical protein